MTSRQRIRDALERRETDRVPIDLGSFHDATLSLRTHQEIGALLEDSYDAYNLYDWTLGMVFPDDRLLRRFHTDTRNVRAGAGKHRDLESFYRDLDIRALDSGEMGQYSPDGVLLNVKPAGSYGFQPVADYPHPLKGELTRQGIDRAFPPPSPQAVRAFAADTEAVARAARRLHDETEFAIVGNYNTVPVIDLWDAAGIEDFYVDVALCPDEIRYAGEKLLEARLPFIETYYRLLGPHIDVAYCVGDDMASQRSASFSVDTYRRLFKSLHRRIIETVRGLTDAKILFHICGAAYPFIPELIDLGVDGINPVQTTAADMQPEKLKREFGRDIAFWGGIDTQEILPFGTRQQVADEARQKVEILGKGGGYVFAPCHNIQVGTPARNIVTMYETVWEMCS